MTTTTKTHTCDPKKCCTTCHDEEVARLHRLRESLAQWGAWGEIAKVDASLASDECKCGCW